MTRVTRSAIAATFLVAAALIGIEPRAAAQEPALDAVLQRAGRYVTDFQRLLSGVVAEETYRQELHEAAAISPTRPRMSAGPTRRELKSDLLRVKPQGSDRWIQFRDVFEVDGKQVR